MANVALKPHEVVEILNFPGPDGIWYINDDTDDLKIFSERFHEKSAFH